ncbi:MAG: HlyD family efflux transporter periplasmic adaptor subunit [Magnetococcales bacterium]|nr:HlyD family efflux transporter periplasmic adaptor subunit [Magnetococcales bacterium]MBF0174965.1 HlyD family efflux transporter periplasmic adaptor subunit [Magnetococcales bacterium]MBF0349143.1 HlyD family efflux transporter periplasmic adaptor subunit [Magnetococcales bacterium]
MPARGEKLILGLSTLLQLGKRAFSAEDEVSFGFLVVNETHHMTPYRQAVLWRQTGPGSGEVVAVSGSPEVSDRAPYIAWLTRILSMEKINLRTSPLCLTAAELEGEERSSWNQWFPTHALWIPLMTGIGKQLGGMLLVKPLPWTEPEIKLLNKLADSYANAWELINRRALKPGIEWRKLLTTNRSRIILELLLLLFLAGWLPVQESVLAPVTVVAVDPMPVRAPMDGIVDRFHITPNQRVRQGDLLLSLDEAVLTNKLEVENRAYSLLQEEYRQVLKQAITDPESRPQKRILEKRMEQQATEANGIRILLDRVHIMSPRNGIALFADGNTWLGKPVQTGERILEIADPDTAEMEIRLPVADVIDLQPGAQVTLYPNLDPLNSWSGTVSKIGYHAQEMEGVLAYAIRAHFDKEVKPPRIGLRGTVIIQGQQTRMFYFLFRRPFALLRERLWM